jgi:hypothetical protein
VGGRQAQLVGLALDRLDDPAAAVAGVDLVGQRAEVEPAPAIGGGEPGALAAGQLDRLDRALGGPGEEERVLHGAPARVFTRRSPVAARIRQFLWQRQRFASLHVGRGSSSACRAHRCQTPRRLVMRTEANAIERVRSACRSAHLADFWLRSHTRDAR